MKNVELRFRVWNIVNPPNSPAIYPVSSPEEGARLIESLARRQLRHPSVHSNVFGLEEQGKDGEWNEWRNKNGEDGDKAFEARRQ